MATSQALAVIGVFEDSADAQQAIAELQRAGFADDQIGVAARHFTEPHTSEVRDLRHEHAPGETYAAEGAITGVTAGAGLGALAGLAIVSGFLPPIGPIIAAGTLGAILTGAAAGAAAMGLAGVLTGLGISKEESEYYQSEFEAGRIVVAVTAPGREGEARSILRRFGAYDMADLGSQVREPVSPGSLSAAETSMPVPLPMEAGAPPMNFRGQPVQEELAEGIDVPVRSQDLVGEPDETSRNTTVHVPVSERDARTPQPPRS